MKDVKSVEKQRKRKLARKARRANRDARGVKVRTPDVIMKKQAKAKVKAWLRSLEEEECKNQNPSPDVTSGSLAASSVSAP